jgi:multidrug efflux pump subunit AcrA (membrane-fusion protein)
MSLLIHRRRLRSLCLQSVLAAMGVGWLSLNAESAEKSNRASGSEPVACESAGASRVDGKVRAAAPGVVLEVFVNVGDTVKKGQILGHTEFDDTKRQLDLARQELDNKTNVEAMQGQAEAWKVTREEIELAVHQRKTAKSRLDWALGMEKQFRATYEAQLAAEKIQQIQYDYWKAQYEKRFFRAPLDGMVSEVRAEVGKSVSYGTHVFTINNDDTYAIPVTVSATLADTAASHGWLTVRSADGKTVSRALVDSVTDDPGGAGQKIIRLLIHAANFPTLARNNLMGMKFDVLLPQVAQEARR